MNFGTHISELQALQLCVLGQYMNTEWSPDDFDPLGGLEGFLRLEDMNV